MATKSLAALAAIERLQNRATYHLTRPKMAKDIVDFHPRMDIGVYRMFNLTLQMWVNGRFADVEDPAKEMIAMKKFSNGMLVQMFRVLFRIPL